MHSLKHGCVHQLNLRMTQPVKTDRLSIHAFLGHMVPIAAIAAILLTLFAPATTAGDVEPHESSLSVDVDVGTSVTFHINIPWPAPPPTVVSVLFGLPESNVSHRGIAEFSVQNKRLSASYRWRPRGSIVPGVQIQYAFEIVSATGASRIGYATFTYIDRALDWHIVTEGPVEIWWQSDTYRSTPVSLVGDITAEALSILQSDFNLALNRPTRLVLYTDANRMRADLGRGTRQWVGGQAHADLNVIILHVPQDLDGITESIAHELTHILISHATDNPFGRVPSWLHEGLATVVESAVGSSNLPYKQIMASIVTCDQLVSLRGLTGSFPASDAQAIAAYAQSHSLVSFVIDRWGKPAIRQLLDAYGTGITDDQAIQETLGLTLDDLESAWIQSLAIPNAPSTRSAGPIVATVVHPAGLNVRTSPCQNGEVAYVAPSYSSIALSGETGIVFGVQWWRVSDGNWVQGSYLDFPTDASSPHAKGSVRGVKPVVQPAEPISTLPVTGVTKAAQSPFGTTLETVRSAATPAPDIAEEIPSQFEMVRSPIAAALLIAFVAVVIGLNIRRRR